MKKFKNTLASAALKRQSRSEASILEPDLLELDRSLENFDYQSEMKSFFENIKGGGVGVKAVEVVSKVFKEFGVKDLDKLAPSAFLTKSNKEDQNGEEKKKNNSVNALLKEHIGAIKTGKRGRPRKIDQEIVGMREERKEETKDENNRMESNKGFNQKIKKFIQEEKKEDEDLGEEKNQKKRKMNENAQFSEFLENVEGNGEGEGSNKKKKMPKGFV